MPTPTLKNYDDLFEELFDSIRIEADESKNEEILILTKFRVACIKKIKSVKEALEEEEEDSVDEYDDDRLTEIELE